MSCRLLAPAVGIYTYVLTNLKLTKCAASWAPCATLNLAGCMQFIEEQFTVSCRLLAPAVGIYTYVYPAS